MSINLLSSQVAEVSFLNEVSFEYNNEVYKVHVHTLMQDDEKIYKLYFKNNIENSEKSLMKLYRKVNAEGTIVWACKADYFSLINEDIAAIAGAAIDKVC